VVSRLRAVSRAAIASLAIGKGAINKAAVNKVVAGGINKKTGVKEPNPAVWN
jgi:hypothetical protein